MRRPLLLAATGLSAAVGLGLMGEQVYLSLKGRLADCLLGRALAATLADGRPRRPWPGADLTTLARIEMPRQEMEWPVLSGAGGMSLAFGVGHVQGSAAPGELGRCALAGHRDRAFRRLAELAVGDAVFIHTAAGTRSYRVTARSIVDERESWVVDPLLGDGLTLITCWPIGALRPGPKRFVVFCEPAGEG